MDNLETKFDEMSTQMLERCMFCCVSILLESLLNGTLAVTQMSGRVDALEASIQDIINGDISSGPSVPQSPSPGTPGGFGAGVRRSGST